MVAHRLLLQALERLLIYGGLDNVRELSLALPFRYSFDYLTTALFDSQATICCQSLRHFMSRIRNLQVMYYQLDLEESTSDTSSEEPSGLWTTFLNSYYAEGIFNFIELAVNLETLCICAPLVMEDNFCMLKTAGLRCLTGLILTRLSEPFN